MHPDGKGGLFLFSATETRWLQKGKKESVPYAPVGSAAGAVTLGQDGRLYLGRSGRVYMVTPDRRVTTVAEGFQEIYGVAVDAQGRLYVADWKAGEVYRVVAGQKTVLARGLEYPSGLGLDRAGRLYVKESGRQVHRDLRVRRISGEGEVGLFAEVDSISRWRKKPAP